jgi:hypothetical protein
MSDKSPSKKIKKLCFTPHPIFRFGLSTGAVALFFLLDSIADEKREVRISLHNISRILGASVPTISKYSLELLQAGKVSGHPPLVSFPCGTHNGSKATLYKLIPKEKLFSLRF